MDKYGYNGIETLLNFCENSKDRSVTPNDFMRMKRVRMPEQKKKKGKWFWSDGMYSCDQCHAAFYETSPFCSMCGADMRGEQDEQT